MAFYVVTAAVDREFSGKAWAGWLGAVIRKVLLFSTFQLKCISSQSSIWKTIEREFWKRPKSYPETIRRAVVFKRHSLRSAFELRITLLMQRCFLVLVLRTPPLRGALSRSGRGSFSHAAPHNHLSAHRSAHLFRVIRLNPQAEWLKQVKSDYVRLPAPTRLS